MEVHESGGLIVEGELEGTRFMAALAALGGQVRSSRSVEPVVGATIRLDSTDHSVVTGADGRFTLDRVLPGPYTLRVLDSVAIPSIRVDSAGMIHPDSSTQQRVIRSATKDIEVLLEGANTADLTFPFRARVPSCTYDGETERGYTVLGTVQGPNGEQLADARVQLAWADTSRRWRSDAPSFRVVTLPELSTISTSVEAVSDSVGRFVMCGIPGARLIEARVLTSLGNELVGNARVSARADGVSRRLRNPDLRGLQLVVRPPD